MDGVGVHRLFGESAERKCPWKGGSPQDSGPGSPCAGHQCPACPHFRTLSIPFCPQGTPTVMAATPSLRLQVQQGHFRVGGRRRTTAPLGWSCLLGQGEVYVRDTDGEDQELMPSSLGLICQVSQRSPLGRTHIRETVQRTQRGTWDTGGTWQVSAFFFLFLTIHTLSCTPPQTAAVRWAEQGARS